MISGRYGHNNGHTTDEAEVDALQANSTGNDRPGNSGNAPGHNQDNNGNNGNANGHSNNGNNGNANGHGK